MTSEEALQRLRTGGELPDLAEAIGTVAGDPGASLDTILLGLKYGGFVAEQAALALYRRTSRTLPEDRGLLVTDPDDWAHWLREQAGRPSKRALKGTTSSAPDLPTAPRDARIRLVGMRHSGSPWTVANVLQATAALAGALVTIIASIQDQRLLMIAGLALCAGMIGAMLERIRK